MDKETLSRYGWVVVVLIIIAILMGAAYPYALFSAGVGNASVSGLGVKVGDALGFKAATLNPDGTITGLATDEVVIDFGLPVKVDVLGNDNVPKGSLTAISKELPEGVELNTVEYDESQFVAGATENLIVDSGTASISEGQIVYDPSVAITNGKDTFYYEYKTDDGKYYYSSVTAVPASNIYFEENEITTITAGTGTNEWNITTEGTPTTYNSLEKDNVYGFGDAYNINNKYSDSTAYLATVNTNEKRSKTATFSFTGTGIDIISACGLNTCTQIINVKSVSTGKSVRANIVDTYFSDDTYGTIFQVPIFSYLGEYDTYIVEITGIYLTTAEAIKNYSGLDNTTLFYNYIDGFRIYDDSGIYSDSYAKGEKNPTYYNVINNLKTGGLFEDLGMNLPNIAYTEKDLADGEVLTFDNYQSVGPECEIYLNGQNNSNSENGLKFKFPANANGRVMISLRAVTDPATAKINGHALNVKSRTEMYYDITDYVDIVDGYATVNIVNTGSNLLSVNNIKTTSPN